MKKKIVIGYTNSKSEEKRVALELYNYLLNVKEFDVELLDFSSCFSVKENNNVIKKMINKIFKNNYNVNDNKIRNSILDFNPNIFISTNYKISVLIENYSLKCKIINMLCEISLDSNVKYLTRKNYYVVNNTVIKSKLIKKNIPSKNILVAGTPTFNIDNINLEEKELTLKKYSLDNNKLVYLFIANGHDYFYEYFKFLAKKQFNINIIFISGKNKFLYDRCSNIVYENNYKNVLVLGYIKDFYNLFNISDVVITKPGTSTLIECMNFKKPSILLPSTTIEERKNLNFMVKNHLSIKANTPTDLVKKVKLTLNYKFLTKSIKNKLMKLNNYNACKEVENLIKKI